MSHAYKTGNITVYPLSQAQKDRIDAAARKSGRSASKFLIVAAEEFIAGRKAAVALPEEERSAAAMFGHPDKIKHFMVRPPFEQREEFRAAALREGMELSPFMLHCAEQYIARHK